MEDRGRWRCFCFCGQSRTNYEAERKTHIKFEQNSALLIIDIQQADYANLTCPKEGDFLISKRRYSAFFGTDLEILLKGLHSETLYLAGGLRDVCIRYTAVDAHQHGYHIRVVTDAVAGSCREAHRYALNAIRYLRRDAWVTAADIRSAR